jgi:hypothetical protein
MFGERGEVAAAGPLDIDTAESPEFLATILFLALYGLTAWPAEEGGKLPVTDPNEMERECEAGDAMLLRSSRACCRGGGRAVRVKLALPGPRS